MRGYGVEEWPSGQWQQTVNLPSSEFAGSNPASSTIFSYTEILPVTFNKSNYPHDKQDIIKIAYANTYR